jgi:hypothetical protein
VLRRPAGRSQVDGSTYADRRMSGPPGARRLRGRCCGAVHRQLRSRTVDHDRSVAAWRRGNMAVGATLRRPGCWCADADPRSPVAVAFRGTGRADQASIMIAVGATSRRSGPVQCCVSADHSSGDRHRRNLSPVPTCVVLRERRSPSPARSAERCATTTAVDPAPPIGEQPDDRWMRVGSRVRAAHGPTTSDHPTPWPGRGGHRGGSHSVAGSSPALTPPMYTPHPSSMGGAGPHGGCGVIDRAGRATAAHGRTPTSAPTSTPSRRAGVQRAGST